MDKIEEMFPIPEEVCGRRLTRNIYVIRTSIPLNYSGCFFQLFSFSTFPPLLSYPCTCCKQGRKLGQMASESQS